MSNVPAGWYADPDPNVESPTLRYWDGTAWTAHTAPAMTQAAPAGPTTPDGEPLAGWWWRVLAYVLDSVIVSFVAGLASLPGYVQVQRDVLPAVERFVEEVDRNPGEPPELRDFYADYFDALQGAVQAHWPWLVVPTVLMTTVYWAAFLRWKGGTPGKLMLGLRVRLRDRRGTLPWSSIAARLLVQFGVVWTFWIAAMMTGSALLIVLSGVVMMIWLIDPLWATWDAERQTLHDKVAATIVVTIR